MKYSGLFSSEVEKLQKQYGLNVLPEEKSISLIRLFISQFANPLIFLLVFAGLISLFLREYLDIVFIFFVVFVNSFFGFFQEYKAQKTLRALKRLIKPTAKVMRDDQRQEIEVSQLVPGDIVFLAAGDKVPADGVILEAVSFLVNEAILTGESEALSKKAEEEVFMGTIISSGRAVIQVVKTGLSTKIGEIAQTLRKTTQPLTTLQLRLKKFTRTIISLSVFLALLVFIAGLIAGQEILQTMRMASVLLVAIIPEALLIVVTLILVIAMQKTLKKKALIKKLLAVETLGSVTTICTDKTGTLTKGEMAVAETSFVDYQKSLLVMCLCNDLSDNAEVAVWDYLEKQKDFKAKEASDYYQRIFEIPFSSEYKYMVTANCPVNPKSKECFLFVKGAPEIVLSMSNLSRGEKTAYLNEIDKWAKRGLKVLGLAYQKSTRDQIGRMKIGNLPKMEWCGAIGLWDPPREEVKEALAIARRAGIKVKVVTGDHRFTAEKIMEFLGMKVEKDQVMEISELEKTGDAELRKRMPEILLFARVTPQQKLRIVRILQEMGEIVAMTGDGVNDAPALKKSNIGIVVGEASEVAKETADLILLDSNFKTIVSAIEEGRTVFDNIKKVVFFMLSDSFAEIFLILGSIILGWPLPLTVVQILWIHLLCDGPEDIVLGFELKEKEVMMEKPRRIDEPIINKFGVFLVFLVSFLSGGYALLLFWYFGLHLQDMEMGRTMVFMAISFDSILYILACRSFRKPLWRYENFWQNKWLFVTVAFSLIFLVAISYIPLMQDLLHLAPLGLFHWGLLLLAAVLITLIIELTKAKIIPANDAEKN